MADFMCPPEFRAAFESLTGELVDLRLAHYTHSRLCSHKAPRGSEGTPLSTAFRATLSNSGGKPILFLPTVESVPSRPTGPTRVRLTDGREWVFRFVKVACNVAHPADAASARGNNALPALLRNCIDKDKILQHLPIPELAAKCCNFLMPQAIPRREGPDAAAGQPKVMSPLSALLDRLPCLASAESTSERVSRSAEEWGSCEYLAAHIR